MYIYGGSVCFYSGSISKYNKNVTKFQYLTSSKKYFLVHYSSIL